MTPALSPPPAPGAIPFADFSSNNESDLQQIDWPTFAAFWLALHPEAGAIIKMSQGDWYRNTYRHRQRWGAHAAGLKNVGLYHYVEVVSQGGANQGQSLTGAQNADAFLATIGDDGAIVPGEFLAGDWEDQAGAGPSADLDAMALDFGGRLLRPTGLAPLLYTGKWFADPHDLNRDPALAQFPLWWASYTPSEPPVPEPWATAGQPIALWQFTSTAKLPGVPFDVDVSWWLAGLPALRAIQWGTAGSPLVGTTDVPLDVDVPANSESLDDMKKVAGVMAGHAAAILAAAPGAQLADVAAKLKAEADWLVRASWGH